MMAADYSKRIERTRSAMGTHGIDVVLLSVGADLPWLTGYEAMPLERLTLCVVPREGDVKLVVPALEAPRVETPPDVLEIVPWGETEDPLAIAASIMGDAQRAAIGDQTWARFVLGLQSITSCAFVRASSVMAPLRARKDEAEIELLREAAQAADRVSSLLAQQRFSGRSERDMARFIAEATVAQGQDRPEFTIVASGPNSASPHHEPTDRVMEVGDTVVVDFGGSIDGYCSDTTRTFSIGEPASEVSAAHEILRSAQEVGRSASLVGTPAERVDAMTRHVIDEAGYGQYFIHRTGHGIGLEVHEDPYLVEGNATPLDEGMAFSIEPGIYIPGRWGMRIEDIVVSTSDGPDVLNNADRSLVVVE